MAPPPGILEVRCAGCGETLEVEPGLTEFACPDCGAQQALPPELMPRRPRRALPIPGRPAPVAAPSRIACGECSAVISVPHGQGRSACPVCGAELTVPPAAAISVVAPPAAVPITPIRSAQPSEVCPGPSSQLTHAGYIQRSIHLEQTHGHDLRHSFREEPFTSSRADTGTEIPVVRKLQNESADPLSQREESHTEPLNETIPRPIKKSIFVASPDSYPVRKVHEEHLSQPLYASEKQRMPSNSSIHADKEEYRFRNDMGTVCSKQKDGNVVAPSILEQEQTKSLNQSADEIPKNTVHADKVQLEFASEAGNCKKSVGGSKGNQKRRSKILMSSSNESPQLRRSKRLLKGSHDILDTHDVLDIDPIEKIDASLNQNISEAPEIGRTQADSDTSSPTRRLDASLPFLATTTSPTITPSSTNLPLNRSSLTSLHQQPPSSLYSQDASCDDLLPGRTSNSSKKRRGRAPEKLMEPREEAERPVLMPSGTDWTVQPPCPKVANTLSILIKQNYPGIYVSYDTIGNDQSCEHVVHHWHQFPPDTRTTILDEFLKRYKWSPGHEEECQKIFDRKAVRQLMNLFCYEKQRVRQVLAAKKTKKSPLVRRAHDEMELEQDGGREDPDEQQGHVSVMVLEHEDPLKWKPFVPVWMKPKWWEMLCDHWAKDENIKMSYQQRKNRYSGKRPCNAASPLKIRLHEEIVDLDNGGKLGVDIYSSTSILRESVDQRAYQTEETGSHSMQRQAGSGKQGRHCDAISVSKKALCEPLSKSSPVCVSKRQQPMFTQEQVQEMINQALQGLNEAWEKKFLSLDQKMPSISSSHSVPNGAKESSLAVRRSKLAWQDTLDSTDGEDPDAEDDRDYQDEEHSS